MVRSASSLCFFPLCLVLQVNNMPMVALVHPVYDCLLRLAQPDALMNEEEVGVRWRTLWVLEQRWTGCRGRPPAVQRRDL